MGKMCSTYEYCTCSVFIAESSRFLTAIRGSLKQEWAGEEVSVGGFGWFQGWNDGCDTNMTRAYETNLANLILDLREEWKAGQDCFVYKYFLRADNPATLDT